jgi:hypothetical protein
MSRLWPPAAAISSARLATSWPLHLCEVGAAVGRLCLGWDRRCDEARTLEVREERQQVGRGDHIELACPARLASLRRGAD